MAECTNDFLHQLANPDFIQPKAICPGVAPFRMDQTLQLQLLIKRQPYRLSTGVSVEFWSFLVWVLIADTNSAQLTEMFVRFLHYYFLEPVESV